MNYESLQQAYFVNSGAALGDPRSCNSSSASLVWWRGMAGVQTSTAIKTLWVMQDVCWNFLKPAFLNPGQRLHRAHVITTTSGRNAIVLQRYLVQLPTHRENAATWLRSGNGFAFCGITKCFGQGPVCLEIKSLFICINFISRSSKRSVRNHNQGIVPQSVNLVTKTLYAKRGTFLSYKALSFSSNS